MNIIITEAQYNELNKEKLREFLFAFWDNQKKHGEEPSLDDMLYNVLDIGKNTHGDYETIRPIWYEYNGGFDVLIEKIENEILGKTFILNDEAMGLKTQFKVKELEFSSNNSFPTKSINIVCEVDKNGMIQYETYDDENDEVIQNTDTIEQAMYELEYDKEDLENYLKGEIYEILGPITDNKFGVAINIEIDFVDNIKSPNSLTESFSNEMDGIKTITKYWKSKLNKGEDMTFNKDELEYFNITEFSPKLRAQEIFYELKGGHEYTTNFIDGLLNKTFSTESFEERIAGGYNFEWVITDYIYEDWKYKLRGEVLPGGTVEMMNGKILTLDEALSNEDFGWEIENEIVDIVKDCMEIVITPKTGAFVRVSSIYVTE